MMKRTSVLLAAVMLAGCCHMPRDTAKIPPLPQPISLNEQVTLLNARARAMPRLRAKGTVVVRYVDDEGNQKKDSAEGVLLVRQRYGAEGAADPADAYLQGRVAGQEVFTASKNQQKWWFIRRDNKTGWMGDVEGPPDFSGIHSGGVMRVDLMLQVLAITEIQVAQGEIIAMKVHDSTRANDIEILRLRGNRTAWVKKEVLVDRDTGDVRQVMLGDPAGKLAVRAELKDYRPINYREDDTQPKDFVPPRFPHDITVTYPTKQLSIHFTVDSAMLLNEAPEPPFETPDFAEMGIKQGR